MTATQRRLLADLSLCLMVSAGAAILLVGANELPPPRFEPLGSAALPRILGVLLLLFSAILAVRAVLRMRQGWEAPVEETGEADPRKGFAVLVALVLYVLALDAGRIPFVPATSVFVVVVGLSIGAKTLRNAMIFAGLGLFLSVSLSTALSRFLYISIG